MGLVEVFDLYVILNVQNGFDFSFVGLIIVLWNYGYFVFDLYEIMLFLMSIMGLFLMSKIMGYCVWFVWNYGPCQGISIANINPNQ